MKMETSAPIHLLSLGAGVQSSTMALMAAAGEISPMPTAAIFADTQAEPASVYKWLDWLESQLPFPVYRVKAKLGLAEESLLIRKRVRTSGEPWSKSLIPAFVANKDGTKGIMGRSCTADKKIAPLLKKEKELAKVPRGCKEIRAITWIGISLDEVTRMKPSREKWASNRWPLIEKRMTRHDCLRWMEKNGYPKPPRSACVFCPFHNDHEWRRLKTEEPKEFMRAVEFERQLQEVKTKSDRMEGVPFLHRSTKPLDQVDFTTDIQRGQLNFFQNECEGMCGL
jgi:hypothetical protein